MKAIEIIRWVSFRPYYINNEITGFLERMKDTDLPGADDAYLTKVHRAIEKETRRFLRVIETNIIDTRGAWDTIEKLNTLHFVLEYWCRFQESLDIDITMNFTVHPTDVYYAASKVAKPRGITEINIDPDPPKIDDNATTIPMDVILTMLSRKNRAYHIISNLDRVFLEKDGPTMETVERARNMLEKLIHAREMNFNLEKYIYNENAFKEDLENLKGILNVVKIVEKTGENKEFPRPGGKLPSSGYELTGRILAMVGA